MTPNSSKVILITGCSSGFGMLTAARLSSKGHHVIATMRDLKKKDTLLNETNIRGGQVQIEYLDVTDKNSIEEVKSKIADTYGYLDILVNNAGYGIGGAFEDLMQEEIRAIMETNFFGVQNVTRAMIPLMRQKKTGKIINISSISGFNSSPLFGAYSSSKWALEAFSESLYYELKPFGIQVLLVEPGPYQTKIFFENARYARNFDNPQSPYYPLSQYFKEKVNERISVNEKDPEDVAALIEKLIHEKNPRFRNIPDIEGQTLALLKRILPFRVFSWLYEKGLYHNSNIKLN